MQYPNKKINWQILWSGATRIGKDLSLKPIAGYYGNMYNDIHPDDDEANKWGDIKAKRKVLAYQEVHRPKDRKFANGLKTYAADTGSGVMTLNMKGGGQIKQYNLFSMYCMSNYTDAIHLTDDDERWFVINSMKVVKKEREYYEQLVDWLDTGGIEAVIRWLLARDLSHFSVSTPPFHTQAKLDLVEESLSDNYRAIETMMHSGAGVFRSDVTVFSRSMLKEFMEKNGSRRVNESILSEELKELLGVDGSSVAKQKNNFARVFINPKSSLHNDAADLLTPSVLYDEYIKSLKIMSIMRYS